jgi:restriction endonuclease
MHTIHAADRSSKSSADFWTKYSAFEPTFLLSYCATHHTAYHYAITATHPYK